MRTKREHCVKSVQMQSFFWSVFSHIWTEYAEVRSISPYSVRMRENTDQKKLRIWTLFTQWMRNKASVVFYEYREIGIKKKQKNGF